MGDRYCCASALWHKYAFGCTPAPKTSADWDATQDAGLRALQQGRYAEADVLISKAVRQAETFGPKDPRLARSLMNQGMLYVNQKRYKEAEVVWLGASLIFEESLGKDHPDFAASLNNLGTL